MKITIVGCGNAGSTVGADLALRGHEVTLLKTSKALHNEHFNAIDRSKTITVIEGSTKKTATVKTSQSFEDAIKGREIVIVFVQTNYHEQIIKKLSDYLEDGQVVLIEPGYLSTCYFLKYCNKKITIAEAESSPIDCRVVEPGTVKVLFRNVCNPIGIYPKQNAEKAMSKLSQMGYSFERLSTVVEAALHNPNLIVHTVGAIMSAPRIEYAAAHQEHYSMYREVFTPHVWNLVSSLDDEKIKILMAVGCKGVSYVEACRHRNSTDESRDATEVFFDYAINSSPDGPDRVDSRYITEDVSEGLVMLESLGKILKIPTPTSSSLINIASALLQKDFRENGRTVQKLQENNINRILKDSLLGELI